MTKPKRYRISFDFKEEHEAKEFFANLVNMMVLSRDLESSDELSLVQRDSLHDHNHKIIHWLVRRNQEGNGRKVA
jgi:hypothetical protein